MHKYISSFVLLVALGSVSAAPAAGKAEHVVVVVWDGMRPDFISAEHTPTLWRLAHEGVLFQNHHSVYVSATDVNGTALATGAYPEHSGVIANVDYRPDINPLRPFPIPDRAALAKGDELSGGNYLARPTVAEILRAAGRQTVIAGTKDVVLLHDRRARADNSPSVNLFAGESLPATVAASVKNSLGAFPDNADLQSNTPNTARDEWTRRAFTDVLWSNGVPAYSLLWLSEPDFSQHAAGRGSPKALAALESSDRQLAAVIAELERRNLRAKTDVFVVSDHGFSTIESTLDVCAVVRQAGLHAVREFKAPPQKGDVLVVGQGGSVLFYVIGHEPEVTRLLVEYLQQQDFTGVVLTRAGLKGTFALADAKINSANAPDVVVSLRWTDKKSGNGTPGMFVSDGGRTPGAGNHASLSRFDLHNTLVGAGPDLKTNFTDTFPTGNVDLAPTILWLLGVPQKTPMDGRVLSEALNGSVPKVGKPTKRRLEASRKLESAVWHQYLQVSRVNDTVYLDEGNGSQTPQ